MTLTFESIVILVIRIIRCYLNAVVNHCVIYEHPWSKNKGGVRVTSKKMIKGWMEGQTDGLKDGPNPLQYISFFQTEWIK